MERSPAQMKNHIEELEKENDALRQKNTLSKAKAEKLGKQIQELSDEFDRKKQTWQHTEFLLKRATTEAEVKTQGMMSKLDAKHSEIYKNLINANKEIIATNLEAMNNIPNALKDLHQESQQQRSKNAEAYVLPLKEGFEKTLQNYKESKDIELANQKEQFEYWLLEKDQALAKMLSGFNKYREKKSVQMRKCEQEIVTLFSYAEKLEVIVKMAEEGKFYMQQSQGGRGGAYGGPESGGGGEAGATMIIPATLKPSRPGSDKTKTSQLALSQRIVKKSKEHAAQDEQIKNDAIEAMLLKHGGHTSAASAGAAVGSGGGGGKSKSREEYVETPEMTNQIRTLLNSPSVGRDFVGTASLAPGASRQKEDKREQLFSRGPPNTGSGSGSDSRRHTISSPTSEDRPPRTSSATVRAHHSSHSAAGPGPRAANSIRKSVSIEDRNNQGNASSFQTTTTDLESSLFRNPENIKYVFNDENDEDDVNNSRSLSPSNFDTMMMMPPAQTESMSVTKTAQELEMFRKEVKRKAAEVQHLEAEVISLRDQLEANEQVDINQILESVEGNETLEYIRQLESEQLSLRASVKEVSSQLQQAKVANAALTRQFQSYKAQMNKRPSSGRVITVKS
jgi:hypothetical protein